MASSITLHGASSSSLSTGPRPYDVFLNFRGEDTRDIFIGHLYNALIQKGIHTYVDEQLRCGEEISEALFKVIKESRIAIVVLSENYASSTWCLRELVEILESMETKHVLPVFYKVDPADVRRQRKSFGEALVKHEGRGDTVQSWKAALTKVANLSGCHLKKGNESKFIYEIVQVVSTMVSPTCLNISANSPVGIKSSVKNINALLSIGVHDKRMVGIFGLGGIGKTTIAQVIYDSISHQFEDKCYLQNVRETSKQEDGLLSLQDKLLSQILRDSHLKVHTVHQGKDVIKKRLCMKKVLLVLDDVDESDQLEALSGELDWFGLESRIIITTRDEHLLSKHGVRLRHKMNELQHDEALKLFSRHAFQSDKPNDDFVELAKCALHYAGGNPLALRVVGSNLYGRDIKHWKSELGKYKIIPPRNIYEILKISYDGLEENEKNIFLDIACFFKGEDVKYVTHILNSCGFYPDSGIRVLMDKSLITINILGELVMHDLLQDMGREIVRQKSPEELGKRSRLWFHEDVRDVLEENLGTENIIGILVDMPKRDLIIQWRSNTLEKMKRLRYFICRNAKFSEIPTYLPNELRVLDWIECPLQFLPSNFRGRKLTILRMRNGLFKGLKEGCQNLSNLSIMELIGLENLTEILDISRISNLQKLCVSECKNLVKVHDFVGFLEKLTVLSFYKCSNLISLPKTLKLRSPEKLYFQYCSRLETFPEIECEMEPYSSRRFNLDVDDCKNLIHLPSSILQLQQLDSLCVIRCPKVVMLPINVRDERQSMLSIESTEESRDLFLPPPLPNSSISDVSCSSVAFPALTGLKIDTIYFHGIDLFSTLGDLKISGSEIVSLPAWIKTFVRLRSLLLFECNQLREILELPANIKEISACKCVSLESIPQISGENQFNTSQLPVLEWIYLSDCYKMAEKIGNQMEDFILDKVHYNNSFAGGIVYPGNRIPNSFRHRMNCPHGSHTCVMSIRGIPHLDEIQGIVVCAVLESTRDGPHGYVDFVQIRMRNKGRKMNKMRCFNYMESKHVWYEYFFKESFELKGDRLQVTLATDSRLSIRSFGVHIIHKDEENVNNHPDMTSVRSCFSFDKIDDELEISSTEDESEKEQNQLEVKFFLLDMDLKVNYKDSYAFRSGIYEQNQLKMENFLLDKNLKVNYKDFYALRSGIYPGNRIPDWFRHRMKCPVGSLSCIMAIKGLPHLDEIQGIIFCAILESARHGPHDFVNSAKFTMRYKLLEIDKMRDFKYMGSSQNIVWYEYFFLESFWLTGDSLQVKLATDLGLSISSFGVHIIHKHEENAKDHPDMTRVESCFSFDGSQDFWETSSTEDEKSEDLVCLIKEDEVDEESENSVGSIEEDECKKIERSGSSGFCDSTEMGSAVSGCAEEGSGSRTGSVGSIEEDECKKIERSGSSEFCDSMERGSAVSGCAGEGSGSRTGSGRWSF